jgi:hypothetical protein
MRIDSLREALEQSHQKLLDVLDGVTEQELEVSQGEHWSILQVVEHLYLVERRIQIPLQAILRRGEHQSRNPQEPLSINPTLTDLDPEKVLGIPAVDKAEPQGAIPLGTLLPKLAKIREKTYGFLEYGATHQMSGTGFNHSYLGYLSFYDWFYLIALHQEAHVLQIQKLHTA